MNNKTIIEEIIYTYSSWTITSHFLSIQSIREKKERNYDNFYLIVIVNDINLKYYRIVNEISLSLSNVVTVALEEMNSNSSSGSNNSK